MTFVPSLPHTISLIGMPGAGKSTVGVILAKLCGLAFNDTDLAIQLHERATLQEIVDRKGHIYLRQVEEIILLKIPLQHAVIATGGSVVYSEAIMRRLRAAGTVVYLDVELPILEQRVAGAPLRGIASDKGESFADIYRERTPLYQQYADLTVNAGAGSADAVAARILGLIARQP